MVHTQLDTAEAVAKMSPEEFATIFLSKPCRGRDVIKVGQFAALSKVSRLAPRMAFRMINEARR